MKKFEKRFAYFAATNLAKNTILGLIFPNFFENFTYINCQFSPTTHLCTSFPLLTHGQCAKGRRRF